MLCYIYCDYFELYVPGKLTAMSSGQMGPLGAVTQGVLLGTSLMMAIPSLMVALSLVLSPLASRWLNIVIGVVYTVLLALIAVDANWYFYKFFATVEAVLTALIAWYAWSWPRAEQPARHRPA
jgi:hypothetical protein